MEFRASPGYIRRPCLNNYYYNNNKKKKRKEGKRKAMLLSMIVSPFCRVSLNPGSRLLRVHDKWEAYVRKYISCLKTSSDTALGDSDCFLVHSVICAQSTVSVDSGSRSSWGRAHCLPWVPAPAPHTRAALD